MPGTRDGGLKAANTNMKRYGSDFYHNIGKLGGQKSTGGGFTKYPGLAREAGRLGGLRSRRGKRVGASSANSHQPEYDL